MIIIVLTLVAAAFNALGAAGEQRAAARLASVEWRRSIPAGTGRPTHGARGTWSRTRALIRGWRRSLVSGYWFAALLVTTPLWLAGWSADVLGFLGQAAALHVGSLSVVQPLMVTTLLFSLPLSALGTGRFPGLRDWAGGVALAGGLVLLLSTRHVSAEQPVHEAPLAATMLLIAAGAAGLAVLTRGRVPIHRAAMLSVAAGALFGVGAAATKLTAQAYTVDGFSGLATSWAAYVLAAASIGGLALQQAGFASGSLPVAMTALVITDPLVSYGLGLVGFGEPAPTTSAALSMAVIGAVVLSAGVAVLAHSPLLQPSGKVDPPRVAAAEDAGSAPQPTTIQVIPSPARVLAARRTDPPTDWPASRRAGQPASTVAAGAWVSSAAPTAAASASPAAPTAGTTAWASPAAPTAGTTVWATTPCRPRTGCVGSSRNC